jgi:hypothetical protein
MSKANASGLDLEAVHEGASSPATRRTPAPGSLEEQSGTGVLRPTLGTLPDVDGLRPFDESASDRPPYRSDR